MSIFKYIQAAKHFGDAKLFFEGEKTTIIHVYNYKYTAVETHVRSPYLYKPFLSLSYLQISVLTHIQSLYLIYIQGNMLFN